MSHELPNFSSEQRFWIAFFLACASLVMNGDIIPRPNIRDIINDLFEMKSADSDITEVVKILFDKGFLEDIPKYQKQRLKLNSKHIQIEYYKATEEGQEELVKIILLYYTLLEKHPITSEKFANYLDNQKIADLEEKKKELDDNSNLFA